MDNLLFASRMADMSGEVQQNNETVVTDIQRLINITNQFADTLGDFVFEIHVSPMRVLQEKFSDIKKLQLYIIYNGNYDVLQLQDKKKECNELVQAFYSAEFEGVEVICEPEYSLYNVWRDGTILLYSALPKVEIDTLSPSDIEMFRKMCMDSFAVSVPNDYVYAKYKSLLIHCNSLDSYPILLGSMIGSESNYGIRILPDDTDRHMRESDIHYVPIIGKTPIQYELPYTFITIDDLPCNQSAND